MRRNSQRNPSACFALAYLLAVASPMFAGEAEATYREIHGLVLNVDGTPAANREVSLIGLARGSTRPYTDDKMLSHWDFTTDVSGKFSAKLGEFNTWDDKNGRPGWGSYVFVAASADSDAGGVSPHLLNFAEERTPRRGDDDEWGQNLVVPRSGISLTLQIKMGVTLRGRVVSYPGGNKPQAGIGVTSNNDLYSESHTGRGGEILFQHTTTSADGSFILKHIYPVRFYLGLGGDYAFRSLSGDEGYWLKTKMADGKWADDAVDALTPTADGSTMEIVIMSSRTPVFRYFGKVSGADGKPIKGAQVTFAVSYHAKPQTHEDSHVCENAITKADGSYEILLPSPWIRGLAVEMAGFERWDQREPTHTDNYTPGEYSFSLKPAVK